MATIHGANNGSSSKAGSTIHHPQTGKKEKEDLDLTG
jgi:hypothetical protein